MSNLMLRIDNVSKQYRLGQIGSTTLYHELQRLGAKLRGREDPTKRIGERDYDEGETFLALDGVSFDVARGERVGIIGHNGAGKSTLLKLISRVTAPTSGTIGLNGRVASMLEVGTGFHGELTGRENIYMNGAILGMTKREIDAKMEDIIEFSECRQFIDTPVKRYSSGMYVKLAFSVAAHLDSEIMIMDEVLAVGDMAFQKKCLEKMSDVSKAEGRTILYVSHNMNTIRQLCERVIVLNHGKVVFDGSVEEGIQAYMDSDEESRTAYDYSDYDRSPNEKRSIEMLGLDILGRSTNKVEIGEDLHVSLHCIGNDCATDMGIRFEVLYADGSVVGTVFSDRLISCQRGERFDVDIMLPTANYTPGRYRYVALVYEVGVHGEQAGIDRVDPAMSLEMVDTSEDALTWLHSYWGHVRYDDMMVRKKTLALEVS